MKRKRLIVYASIVTVALVAAFIVPKSIFASRNPKKISLGNFTYKTEKAQEKALKVEAKLNDAWNDIKDTFNIDDSDYTILSTAEDMNAFINLQLPGMDNKEIVYSIYGQVMEIMKNPPKGSTIPVIMVKNDLSSFDVCYKLADGTNVSNHGTLKNGVWEIKSESKKGKPQMSVE